jgi:pimeloyl-ACP methyl ester carboxylesterase
MWTMSYIAHNGVERAAYLLLPFSYRPASDPPLPLVISPHGRGGDGRANARFWGELPAIGRFAVINPDGMGRRLGRLSYGYSGQIEDLARMPQLATKALPWLRLDRERIYALGSSMGGQETLLLVARHPRLLAGAAAMDSVTDLGRRYRQLPGVPCNDHCLARWGRPYGHVLQAAMAREVGGTPSDAPKKYEARSASSLVDELAFSRVPLQVWWSDKDQIVFDQEHQSAALVRRLRRVNRCAPVTAYAGTWRHSQAMWSGSLLPVAVAGFGLLPRGFPGVPADRDEGRCVPLAGLSGIPQLIAKGLRCESPPESTCT